MFIHGWPYTNLHDLNLDWIVEEVKGVHDFTIPKNGGDWDKNKSYEPLTFVTHNGTSYISVEPVPRGIDIDDTYYWYNLQVNFAELINSVLFFPLAGNANDKSKSMAVICTDGAEGQKRLVLRGIGPTGITSQITLVDANGRVQLPSAIPVPLVEGGTGANSAGNARDNLGAVARYNGVMYWALGANTNPFNGYPRASIRQSGTGSNKHVALFVEMDASTSYGFPLVHKDGTRAFLQDVNPAISWLLGANTDTNGYPRVELMQTGPRGDKGLTLVVRLSESSTLYHPLVSSTGERLYALTDEIRWKAAGSWDEAVAGATSEIMVVFELINTVSVSGSYYPADMACRIPVNRLTSGRRFYSGDTLVYGAITAQCGCSARIGALVNYYVVRDGNTLTDGTDYNVTILYR